MVDLKEKRKALKEKIRHAYDSIEFITEEDKDLLDEIISEVSSLIKLEKQAEIDSLKAELTALHESRASFVEYCQKIESGDYVIVPKEPTDSMIEHAYGTYEGANILRYSFYKAMIEAAQGDGDE
ncbi:hypothetical protein ACG92Y_12585 [Acinetobacter ursingii]|uniref:hypothetical protein n=1 Tax=Acinetobacter ursingii TaxID=108980 RepID=UPI003AF7CE93